MYNRGMKFVSFSILSILFFLLNSCATDKIVDRPEENLVKSFSLTKKQFKKYEAKPVEKKPQVAKKEKKKKHNTSIKLKSSKSPRRKKPRFERFPANYPKNYIKYLKNSSKVWSSFSPNFKIGEEHHLKIKYLGIKVGYLSLFVKKNVLIADREAYHFKGVLKSASYYEMLYKLDDTINSFVDVENFLPLKFTMTQRETKKSIDDLQIFNHLELKTYHWWKKEKKGRKSEGKKEVFIPHYFQDWFSSIFFMRGLPLKTGDKYEFPLVSKGKVSLSKARVIGVEEVRINKKWMMAIRVEGSNHFPGKKKKKGNMIFWFSNDDARKLLKIEGEIKIGSIEGELVRYTE
jgi:hypothetical protein